jgi:isoleucyl-tRNA synthetase
VSLVIWTTTPWTLPANEAVALGPDIEYVVLWVSRNRQSELLVLANDLVDACLARYGLGKGQVLAQFTGKQLEHLQLAHPFLDKHVPVIVGGHVTLEAGTGAVHTAPAHGQDDFVVGLTYSLPVDNPVMGDGRFRDGTPFVAGVKVDEANKVLIQELETRGRLLKHEPIRHSYPHCWRHKTPLIFRATPQWFISMEQKGLRANALRDIQKTQWFPAWGEQRIFNMIKDRPDWCLSRQRTWGVPITLFVHKQTQELHPRTQELIEQVAARVEKEGIDAWFDLDAKELLGAEADAYEKVSDVMDVWADSGLSFECVHHTHPDEVKPPVEIYLEGSDQHRGWFHSSLLMSEALYERAPYKTVLTHGFTVDEKGIKMSKSLGNVIEPRKVMQTSGADVLRLWIAATDYSNEMALSEEILKRMSESYRRIRNTVRYLLGSLAGFDPAADAVPLEEMVAIDRWALKRAAALQEEIAEAYRKYEYHVIYQKVHNFCVVDLGGFYLDLLKDRLYTTPKQGRPRRSAQTALFHVAEAMVRWIAPILSYTADEIWGFMPGSRSESVFLETWHQLPAPPEDGAIDWNLFIQLKAAVAQEMEKLRVAGSIGGTLDAEVEVFAKDEFREKLMALGEELRFLLITSDAKVKRVSNAAGPPVGAVKVVEIAKEGGVWVRVQASTAPKCERCWHHRPSAGSRVQSGTSDHLRSLRGQCRWTGRAQAIRMNDEVIPPLAKSGIRWLWISLLVIVVDQLTKFWIETNFVLGERIDVLPVLEIIRAHNPGAAFSFLAAAGGWQRWAFTALALGVSVALVFWLRRLPLETRALLACGLALILGGAIGNVVDRIEHGYVVDFVNAHWGNAYFPAFNVADSAISIGAGLVILDAIRDWRREREASISRGQP